MRKLIASGEAKRDPTVPSSGPRVEVSAFQIDDLAIATIKQGDELLASGMYPARRLPGGNISLLVGESDLDSDALAVFVEKINYDPKVVGEPAKPGQFRMLWSGHAFLDPDPEDGAGVAQSISPEANNE